MPAAEDGEWSNWCSNVVCVRTKSSKESENSPEGQVIQVQPIVVRSVYRQEPVLTAPLPRTVHQSRRITRLIQSPLVSSTSPIQYKGIGRVSLSLKAPSISSSIGNGPLYVEYSRPSFPPFRRSPAPIVLKKPFEHRLDHLPFIDSSSLLYSSGRDFRPSFSLPSSSVRASSLPPFLSTAHVRRSSIAVPSYSATTYGYGGRPIVGGTGGLRSSLRRGSVDVSYLQSAPDFLRSSSYLRPTVPSVRSDAGLRNTYRRGSLSIPRDRPSTYRSSTVGRFDEDESSSYMRPTVPSVRSDAGLRNTYRRGSLSVPRDRPSTYRSSTVGRFDEDELKSSVPLSSASETLSSLRTKTQRAKDKLDTHRSLIDRYLPGGSREPSIDTRFDFRDSSVSRRSSISTLPRPLTGSRAPSLERANDLSSAAAVSRTLPATPNMSAARRRIRNVLFKVSGAEEFLE